MYLRYGMGEVARDRQEMMRYKQRYRQFSRRRSVGRSRRRHPMTPFRHCFANPIAVARYTERADPSSCASVGLQSMWYGIILELARFSVHIGVE